MKNKKEALKRQKAIEEILKLQKDLKHDPWMDEPLTAEEQKLFEEADKHQQEWIDKQSNKDKNITSIYKEIEK